MTCNEIRHSKKTKPISQIAIGAVLLSLMLLIGLLEVHTSQSRAAEDTLPGEALSPAQEQEVLRLFQRYLTEHPEDLVKALKTHSANEKFVRAAEFQQTLATDRSEIERDVGSYVAGNPDGNISLVEFFDYRCSFCKKTHSVVQDLLKKDGNIRFVYKEFPILGPDSVIASRAALASRKQGKYLEFHNALMSARGALNQARILEIAQDTGVNVARLKSDMKDPEIEKILDRNHALAQRLNINGTPAFIIGDQLLAGAAGIGRFKTLVREARTSCKTC